MHSADRLWAELNVTRDLAAALAPIANAATLAVLDRRVARAWAAYREASAWHEALAAQIAARPSSPPARA